jgi:hypothetical protein
MCTSYFEQIAVNISATRVKTRPSKLNHRITSKNSKKAMLSIGKEQKIRPAAYKMIRMLSLFHFILMSLARNQYKDH